MNFLHQRNLRLICSLSRHLASARLWYLIGVVIYFMAMFAIAPIAKAQVHADAKKCFVDYITINKKLALQKVADCSLYIALSGTSLSDRIQAHWERAGQYSFLKRYHEAIADATIVINANILVNSEPNKAAIHFWRAYYYEKIGMRQEAMRGFRKALQLDPSLEASKEKLKQLGVGAE